MKRIWDFLSKRGFITWGLLLLIWQLASMINPSEFLPGPVQTLLGGKEIVSNGVLCQYIGISFFRIFSGWFLGIIIYATTFPIIINTIAGVIGINNTTFQVALSQGATPAQIFFTVTIPASAPYIFTGIRLGLSGAIISIVAAEMLAAQKGIGYLIYTSRLYFRTDWIFVGILTLGLTGYFSDRLLRLFGKTVLRRFGVTDRK
jgi:NitT/TauT family transport system permease protein